MSRRLPDTLVVDIVERSPAAIWQHNNRLSLIDEKGVVLEPVSVATMPDLPLVIGPDDPKADAPSVLVVTRGATRSEFVVEAVGPADFEGAALTREPVRALMPRIAMRGVPVPCTNNSSFSRSKNERIRSATSCMSL